MTDIVPSVDPATIASRIESNINDYYLLSYVRLPGAVLHADEESSWIQTGLPGAKFNSVGWARFQPETIDRQIDAVLDCFRTRSLPIVWHVGPTTEPADLGDALLKHGMVFVEDEPGMALEIARMNNSIPVPSELSIEVVSNEDELYEWINVWLFPMQDEIRRAHFLARRALWLESDRTLTCFVGRWEGKPVATSMLYLGKGVAAVHHVATLPEYRRRGIGSAMTLRVLHEARNRGYRVAVLTASSEGIGSYRRIGFHEYCSFRRYEWGPDSGD